MKSIAPTQEINNAQTQQEALLGDTQVTAEEQSVTTYEDAVPADHETADVAKFTEQSDDLSSLKRFLGKPRLVQTTALNTLTDANTRTMGDFALYFGMFDIITKLYNYAGCRFTMCAKVMVNTTPFDQGMTVLMYKPPFYDRRATGIGADETKFQFMKLPHSVLDVGEQTSVELRVPFYSPLRFLKTIDLLNLDYLGQFVVVNPLNDVQANNNSQMKLYFWIEDVELLYPTNLSGNSMMKWEPQGPTKENVKGGQVVLTQSNYDSNYQVTAQAVPYAMNVVNKDYDKCATKTFESLFQTEDLIDWMDISAGTSAVLKIPVGPRSNARGAISRMALTGVFFHLYSGSINYRLKIFKTKFQAGRLQIAFLPHWDMTNAVPEALDDFWNIVWDFSESSELAFSIPYVDNKFMTLTSEHQGVLVIRQLTPMQAPDSVSQTVRLAVFGAMGEDLQVACPRNTMNYMPNIQVVKAVGEEWMPQGPKSISDRPVSTPTNFVNEGTCSLKEYVAKNFDAIEVPVKRFTWANGIFFPTTMCAASFTITSSNSIPTGSGVHVLANLFEFYRGDLVLKGPLSDGKPYYTELFDGDDSSITSPFFSIPYVSNLRYNSVFLGGSDANAKVRLHNAEFFYPWYPLRAYT